MCAKLFMREPYDKARYAPKRLRGFLDLVRPFTLLAPAIGGICGSFLALIVEGKLSMPYFDIAFPFFFWPGLPFYAIISGITSLIFLNAASNTLNQVYDRKIDRVNKAYRPIPSGIVTPKEGLWISLILYGLSLWRAAMVNRSFIFLVLILILFTISYSVPPLRLKKRLWISNISVAVPRGMLGFVAAWTIAGSIFDPIPWIIGSIMTLFLIGSTTTKDLTDMEGDRMFGMDTLPVHYGKKLSILLSAPFFILPFALMLLYWYYKLLPGPSIVMAGIFSLWSAVLIYLLYKEGDKEDEHFENSPAWKQMYLMLMGMQVGFLAIFIV